ncbi:MAG: hypothetical protein ACT4QG_23250 [Sporichthyaceae bacterium]
MVSAALPLSLARATGRTASRIAAGVLLAAVGTGLDQAARRSARMRAQINTDETIEVRTGDGVAHHYRFDGRSHSVRSVRGPAPRTTSLSVTFDTSGLAFLTLARPNALKHVVRLMRSGRVVYTGNAANVLWFWGLTRTVVPYDRERPMRRALPGALTAPDPASRVADRIVREDVATELDPTLTDVARARAKMAMLAQGSGQTVPWW